MKFIAICAYDCVPIDLVLKDVAKSIVEGYGGGTVIVKGYENLHCSWTSYEQCSGKNDIIISSDVELSMFQMADLVCKYKNK